MPNDEMTTEEFERFMATRSVRRNKFGAVRTDYGGRTYDSRAEADYAANLDLLIIEGKIERWEAQPEYQLGEDFKYRVDFLVTGRGGKQWVVDVKGVETPRFKQAKKLWKKYGPLPLHIAKKGGAVEIVQGAPF